MKIVNIITKYFTTNLYFFIFIRKADSIAKKASAPSPRMIQSDQTDAGGMIVDKRIQAVFIDRDGTMGGTGHFIHPRDFVPYPFSLQAISMLKREGFKLFAFTNQHRISRGEASEAEFREQFASYGFDHSYICPHAMDENCGCRKPSPGMLLQAAHEHRLDLARCAVIGDVGSTDMVAAAAAGTMKIIVKTGWGESSLTEYRHTWADVEPDYIAEDLLDAARWLISGPSSAK